MQSVLPSDISCEAISKAFLEYCKESKSEGLGTRLCILFASYPACCQDYAICHFLRLLQSFQFLLTSSCSQSVWTLYHLSQPDQDLDQQRHSAGSSAKDLCSMVGFLKGGVQQNWRRQKLSVLDGCVLWGARVVIPPPGRERVIQELREIHVYTLRHCRADGNGTAGTAMAVPVFEGEKWRRLGSNLRVRYGMASPSVTWDV